MFSAFRIDFNGSRHPLLSTMGTKFSACAGGSDNLSNKETVPSLAVVDNVWKGTSLLFEERNFWGTEQVGRS